MNVTTLRVFLEGGFFFCVEVALFVVYQAERISMGRPVPKS